MAQIHRGKDPKGNFEDRCIMALRAAGFRITMPRIAILRVLEESPRALDAQGIHDLLKARGDRVDLVSVYRTLHTLLEVGLVHHLGVVDAYSACMFAGEHDGQAQHFVCETCGQVTEFLMPSETEARIARQVEDSGFRPKSLRVEILGACARCEQSGTHA